LQTRKDDNQSLRVHGLTPTKAGTWKVSGSVLVNAATDTELGMTPRLLHTFSVDEMRDLERQHARSERENAAKVLHLLSEICMNQSQMPIA
jgi:hypothetical protein